MVNQYYSPNTVDFNLDSIKAGKMGTNVYLYEEDRTIWNYVYYNYDGNHATSIWKVVGKSNNGNLKIVNTKAIGNITLPETSTVAEAVTEWNNIPNKVNNALNLVTESTFRDGNPECNTVFETGTTSITINSTMYTVNSYDTDDSEIINELYHISSEDKRDSTFLIHLGIVGNELYVTTYTYPYSTGNPYVSSGANIREFNNMGIEIVVTLKSGVTLDKTSGDGTYASPYGLTNSGS